MKSQDRGMEPGSEALNRAAAWFVDFRVGDVNAAGREAFNAWLRRSPENIQAYIEIANLWSELPATNAGRALDVESVIAHARAQRNVICRGGPHRIDGAQGAVRPGRHIPLWRQRNPVMLAAAAVLLLGLGLLASLAAFTGTMYETRIGEQRFISLADGSTVELNARSRLRVLFSEQERRVDLLQGQALFQVAKDKSRPFVVRSDGVAVRAVGTQFDVYRKESGTRITVVEGRVAVLGNNPAIRLFREQARKPQPVFVSAGEQVTAHSRAIVPPTRANVAAATAWTQHRLIFESSRLADVAHEFNRYNLRQLVIEAGPLEDLHISGVYSSTDPASLVRFLINQRGIGVTEQGNEIRVFSK